MINMGPAGVQDQSSSLQRLGVEARTLKPKKARIGSGG